MRIRRGVISPTVATVILVAIAIVIAIAVAFWATGLVHIFYEETYIATGVIKKVDSKYILISASNDKQYILKGPEEVLDPLSKIPAKITLQGRLIRENMTIQVKKVEINIPSFWAR